MELFVSELLHPEVHSVDSVFRDNGSLNWPLGDKMSGESGLRESVRFFSETLKEWREM